MNDRDRYNRQRILPQIGQSGQQRLSEARVLLIGCGALGSTLAELLVRAGVGFMRLVDRDLVELSNLQRQVLFDEQDAQRQMPKSVAAAQRLARINSTVKIEPIVADAHAANLPALADIGQQRPVDLILDGADNVAVRYLINDLAVQQGISWIYAGCVETGGRVMSIVPGGTACLRCLFPQPPAAQQLPTCDTAGVLGPAAVAVAALAAAAAMRLLVGAGPLPRGLICLDLWTGESRDLISATAPAADCPCCGKRQFPFLCQTDGDWTTTLCGRAAVQVLQAGRTCVDLGSAARRWQRIGKVQQSPWFVRCRLHEPEGIDLTLFGDGRLLVHGTTDPMRARSIYSRFVGS
jgi:adenylyltransferase/sulfurtransferase